MPAEAGVRKRPEKAKFIGVLFVLKIWRRSESPLPLFSFIQPISFSPAWLKVGDWFNDKKRQSAKQDKYTKEV